VIATGITTKIRDFILMAAAEIGLEVTFTGDGIDEKGYLTGIDEKLFAATVGEQYIENQKSKIKNNFPIVEVDPQYFRPTEVELLIGDATKARTQLNWEPKYDLLGLVTDMMQSDIKLMKKDAWLREGGYRTLNYFE